MNVLIVTESCFGNTSRVADAVAAGLRSTGAEVTVAEAAAAPALDGVDLLLVGAPTHNMGLPGPASRRQAAMKGGSPAATGVTEWLDRLPTGFAGRAATFDTVTGTGFFSGSAAKGIQKRLRRQRVDVVARASFVVTATEGPLADGELDRARLWGAGLA
ncbi:flavodoxin domain-containing protein [Micromonospora sp. WMMD718]|uniref:flavodoxin family protein n=1 Tax=unclassified Micromonospora TaxID=2617518 RepID=UPI00064C050F|nr:MULTISPECIES: flavodoxin domain-containing protein [unclassified Micromonospora]MDG4752606.1 flavodoxin domain-containing protein [Micromonospora sp. WMMD718]WFF05874.1 flavodoxin domain-containing protein [Micromonospora sp. WMMD1076]